MASVTELRRVVDIRAKTTGVKEAAGDLKKLDAAYTGVTVESAKLEKATLSVDRQFASLQRRIDPAFRATERLAAAEKTLNAAQAQGLITLARKNELLALASVESNRAAVATGRLAAAQRSLSGLGGVAAGAVGLGGGAAVTGILAAGFAVSAFVKNSIEAQKVLAQLQAVVTSTGGAAGYTAAQLADMASGLQRVTTFDDEAIAGAEGLLLTFTKIGHDTIPVATQAILDLSTAMGQDLKSSTVQIGKALNDPIKGITALTRVGVTFTEAQKVMITSLVKTGDLAGAQAIILRELQTEFGGSAAAARDTLGGALTALGNAFGDLFEVSGEGSKALTDSINDLTNTLSDPATIAAIQKFGAAMFDAVSGATKAITFLIENMERLHMVLRVIGGGGVGAASVGFDIAAQSQIVESTAAGFDKLTASASAAAAAVTTVEPPMQEVAASAGKLKDAMINGVKVPLPNLRPEIDNVVQGLDRAQSAAADFATSLVGGVANGGSVLDALGTAISGLTSTLGSSLGNSVSGLIGGATSGIFGSILSGLGGGLVSSLVSGLGGLFKSIFGGNDAEEQARREEARLKREEKLQARKEELARKEEKRQSLSESRAGYTDRAFVAGLDTSTLGGQLAQFDREALRERQAVKDSISNAKKRDEQLAALDKALAAERLKIQQDYNDQAIADAKAAADELNQVARSIVDYVNGLNTSSDSPLSPQDRFTAAQAAYNSQLALAQGGNVDAQSSITSYADTFLKAAREMYASSTAFQDIFTAVKSQLLALPAVTQSTDPVVVALAGVQTALLGALSPLAKDTSLGTLAKDASLTNATNGLPGINTKVTGVAKDASLTGVAKDTTVSGVAKDTSLTTVNTNLGDSGIKKWTRNSAYVTKAFADQTVPWLQLISKRLYVISDRQKNTDPLGGPDKPTSTELKNGLTKGTFTTPGAWVAATGGVVPHFAGGGVIGNGQWNRDSVMAHYAGGRGRVMLAGGEGVINAAATSMIGPSVVDLINRTGRLPENDNAKHFGDLMRVNLASTRALIQTLQDEIAGLRAEVRGGSERTARAVERKPVAKPATKVA